MHKILTAWVKRYWSQPEAIILSLILVGGVVVFKTIGQILTPVIVSIVLAYFLSLIVRQLERWHCPHLLAVIMVFILFIGLLLLLFLWLLPLLWTQTVGLISELPSVLRKGQVWVHGLHEQFPDFISASQLHQLIGHIGSYFVSFSKEIVTFSIMSLTGIATLGVYFILVPLLVFFFLRDGHKIVVWVTRFLPEKRETLQKIWCELCDKVGSFIRAKLIEIVVIALLAIALFWIFRLQYTVLLGALVGLSVLIPYIGISLVTIPIVIVGLINWGWSDTFWYLMLSYTLLNLFDANVLSPLLFSEVMDLHPLAIILAVLVFGTLFGFWGIFFAIPLLALLYVVIQAWPRGE